MEGIFETIDISENEIPDIISCYPEDQRSYRLLEWLRFELQVENIEFEVVLGAVRVCYKPDKLKWEY